MKFINLVSLCLTLCFSGLLYATEENDKIQLPDMGDSTGTLITPLQEKELGKAFFRSIHAQLEISQDPDIDQYIQSLGARLVTNSDNPSGDFHFFVVLDNGINAFAGPGGYIGVNSGLILTSESESELASVMAHEIAHVTQRHLYRAYEAANQLSIPTAAATIAAILLGTQSAELGQAALMAIQAGNAQAQINFTRSNEEEADRVGMQTLAQSDLDPRSMPVFFERLQQSSRYYGQGIPEFLRTHPVTSSRISDTRNRAEKYPYKQYPDSMDYQLAKAKLRVLTAQNTDDIYSYFTTASKQGITQQRAVARYGLALIYLEKNQFQKARSIFSQLTAEYPRQQQYIAALARIEVDTHHYEKALQIYQTALKQHPNNFWLKMEYIDTLLKADQPEPARKLLQSLSYEQQQYPVYFGLMAETYSKLNHQSESHRYLAEYYYSIGNTQAAITQIKLAQKSDDLNFYLSAILDERLHFLYEEERLRQSGQ